LPLTESELCEAFKTYFDEMDKCAAAECNWALLHVVLVMPDICAALEHPKGDTTNESRLVHRLLVLRRRVAG
jgi:hypothetical protein